MAETVYRSKIDKWLLVTFAVSALASLAAFIPLVYVGLSLSSLVMIPILLMGIGLPLWVLETTAYTLTDRTLVVRCGPFHWDVPLWQITRITITRSPLSSPALSLDRLRIQYTAGAQIMISPDDRDRFLKDLRARGVNLEISR